METRAAKSGKPFSRAAALWFTASYAVVAGAWMFLWDRLAGVLVTDPARFSQVSNLKGVLFVTISALLLFALLKRRPPTHGPIEEAEVAEDRPTWLSPLLASGFFLLAVAGTGFAVFEAAKLSVIEAVNHELAAVANLKAGQIERWLRDRREDVQLFVETPLFAEELQRWLEGGMRDNVRRERLLRHLRRASGSVDFLDVSLYSATDGARLLTIGAHPDIPSLRRQAMEAAGRGEPVLEDIHYVEGGGPAAIEIGYFSPVRVAGAARPIAVVHFSIDPIGQLFPLMQQWPGPSPSAETLLVRADGGDVVYLNTVRHRPDTAPLFRLPASDGLIAAGAIAGSTGALRGRDYRGVPALAHIVPVGGTPWYLVAKVDEKESYVLLETQALLAAAVIGILFLAGTWWWMERQRYAEARHRDQLQRAVLAKRLDYLARYANDCIVLVDLSGRILDVNDRSLSAWGYGREQMLGMNAIELRAPRARAGFPALLQRIAREGSLLYESDYRRKDGSEFPAEVSARLIEVDGGRCIQAIVRDISERRRAEERAREYAQEIEDLYQHAPCGYHSIDAQGVIRRMNDTELRWLGYAREEVVGKMTLAELLTPASRAAFDETFPELKRSGAVRDLERELVRRDGTILPVLISSTAMRDAQGGFVMTRSTVFDMSERRKIEAERAEHARRLEELSRRVVAVQEAERRQLAAELHDRASPNLAAMKINLGIIAAELAPAALEGVAARLEDTDTLLADSAASIREICFDLRPVVLDYAGLLPALDTYAHQFADRTGIAVRVTGADRQARLPSDIESSLFRIVQEALTNASRHAQASAIDIELATDGGHAALTISDDGRGFDPEALRPSDYAPGLLTMRERAEFAGGKFSIESRPGQGTRVRVEI